MAKAGWTTQPEHLVCPCIFLFFSSLSLSPFLVFATSLSVPPPPTDPSHLLLFSSPPLLLRSSASRLPSCPPLSALFSSSTLLFSFPLLLASSQPLFFSAPRLLRSSSPSHPFTPPTSLPPPTPHPPISPNAWHMPGCHEERKERARRRHRPNRTSSSRTFKKWQNKLT